MAKTRIRKGDTVQVIAGKDRGATGKVLVVLRSQDRVLVEGVNRIKKHTKVTTSSRGAQEGGIVHQEAPIHLSNVMLTVEQDGKRVPTRVGIREHTEEGEKLRRIRISRRTGEDI
jgi:large subunit ribosomal protein L24